MIDEQEKATAAAQEREKEHAAEVASLVAAEEVARADAEAARRWPCSRTQGRGRKRERVGAAGGAGGAEGPERGRPIPRGPGPR